MIISELFELVEQKQRIDNKIYARIFYHLNKLIRDKKIGTPEMHRLCEHDYSAISIVDYYRRAKGIQVVITVSAQMHGRITDELYLDEDLLKTFGNNGTE